MPQSLPPPDAALTDAVLRPLSYGLRGEALAALCHGIGLTISHMPRQDQDAVLALVQSRIAAEVRVQQGARDWLASHSKRSA
jgi:DNA mismatch repair ATPase MutL